MNDNDKLLFKSLLLVLLVYLIGQQTSAASGKTISKRKAEESELSSNLTEAQEEKGANFETLKEDLHQSEISNSGNEGGSRSDNLNDANSTTVVSPVESESADWQLLSAQGELNEDPKSSKPEPDESRSETNEGEGRERSRSDVENDVQTSEEPNDDNERSSVDEGLESELMTEVKSGESRSQNLSKSNDHESGESSSKLESELKSNSAEVEAEAPDFFIASKPDEAEEIGKDELESTDEATTTNNSTSGESNKDNNSSTTTQELEEVQSRSGILINESEDGIKYRFDDATKKEGNTERTTTSESMLDGSRSDLDVAESSRDSPTFVSKITEQKTPKTLIGKKIRGETSELRTTSSPSHIMANRGTNSSLVPNSITSQIMDQVNELMDIRGASSTTINPPKSKNNKDKKRTKGVNRPWWWFNKNFSKTQSTTKSPAACPYATTNPNCKCDYRDIKDSDKLLAVVTTNKGGFKGRRINSKAIEAIMMGKVNDNQLLDIKAEKSISVSSNNTYIFPAGHYYFPNPIRFAGLVYP